MDAVKIYNWNLNKSPMLIKDANFILGDIGTNVIRLQVCSDADKAYLILSPLDPTEKSLMFEQNFSGNSVDFRLTNLDPREYRPTFILEKDGVRQKISCGAKNIEIIDCLPVNIDNFAAPMPPPYAFRILDGELQNLVEDGASIPDYTLVNGELVYDSKLLPLFPNMRIVGKRLVYDL